MNAIQNVSPVVASTGWAKMRAAGKTVIRVACWRRPPCESQTTSRYKPKHAVPAHTPRATNSIESPRSVGPSSPAFADLATSCPRNPAHRHAIPIAIASQTISRTGRGRLREPGPHRRAASDSLACVRQIYPDADPAADDDDFLARRYAYPAGDGTAARPWVRANMVASVDGAAALEGRSGGLGGAADRKLFHVLRSLADVVLVGGGTARAEKYKPARLQVMVPALRAGRPPTAP